ncbi:MAG: hypothetical protein DRH04_07910 [Deltaproteobacteria bacterium]|nr:MAG: hypothetical protein DRH04_07910 [Deltaproteobacteria bacterium]
MLENRVGKKLTPFLEAKPTKALILVNLTDPQINTIKSFIQACESYGIDYAVFGNKLDRLTEIEANKVVSELSVELGKIVIPISAKYEYNLEKVKSYLDKFSKERIIFLGVFNSGKTTLINKLCGTNFEVGDIPGTTLKFVEVPYKDGNVIIDSVGQLIDVSKPMMVSIDFNGCKTIEDAIIRVFKEEINGIQETLDQPHLVEQIKQVVNVILKQIEKGKKVITVGAGASALVAKEMAGQGTECGLPIMVFTNDLAEAQPIAFSKGIAEESGGLAKYISLTVNEGDIVIGISASGGTGFVYDTLRRAKEKGAVTVAITENPDTPLGHYADYIVKSNAKPEGPSSSKIQTAHLVIAHCIILNVAREMGLTADQSIQFMLPEKVKTKKMGIK